MCFKSTKQETGKDRLFPGSFIFYTNFTFYRDISDWFK